MADEGLHPFKWRAVIIAVVGVVLLHASIVAVSLALGVALGVVGAAMGGSLTGWLSLALLMTAPASMVWLDKHPWPRSAMQRMVPRPWLPGRWAWRLWLLTVGLVEGSLAAFWIQDGSTPELRAQNTAIAVFVWVLFMAVAWGQGKLLGDLAGDGVAIQDPGHGVNGKMG